MKGTRASGDWAPIPSLEVELGFLQKAAEQLQNSPEAARIHESVAGISLYFKHLIETHSMEVRQLQDELRLLHEMVRDKSVDTQQAKANQWRAQLQRRATLESKIRKVLERGEVCSIVCVPIPSPLATQTGTPDLERFLTELSRYQNGGDSEDDAYTAVWSSKLAVVWRPEPLAAGSNQRLLPETTRIGDSNYVVRSRAWEVVSDPGEGADSYLKRLSEARRASNAS